MLFLDDEALLASNINFISDVKNFPQLFIKDCYYQKGTKNYYRPVLTLIFAIEISFFGNNSKVNHITNIILFILCIYLMYIFLLKLNLNKIILKLVLLLVLVHPVFTSVVVWIAGRNDSLLTISVILSLINTFCYLKKEKNVYLLLSIIFFALSLFTKESGLILIVITPLFLYLLNKLNNKKVLNLFFGFFLIIVLYLYLRSFAVTNISIYAYIQNFSFILKNIINGFIVYINKLLIPNDVPIILNNYSPDILNIIIFILFVIFLLIIYLKNFINKKFMLFGILFFILYLLPTFAMFENQILFHRLLLPSLGLSLVFVLFIQKIVELYPVSKKYLLFSFTILFLIFSFGSFVQADKYKNNALFVVNGYKDAPTDHLFVCAMGNLFTEKGNYDKALEFLYLAEKQKPNYYLNDIAAVLCYQKKFDEAEDILKRSIDLNKVQRDVSYANLSLIYEKKQDYKTALEYALKAYQENPYNVDWAVNLARQFYLNAEYKQALDIYFKLLKFNKKQHQYHYSIALLYDKLGDKQKAIEYINKAIQLDKDNQKYNEFLLNFSEQKQG